MYESGSGSPQCFLRRCCEAESVKGWEVTPDSGLDPVKAKVPPRKKHAKLMSEQEKMSRVDGNRFSSFGKQTTPCD